MIRLALGLKIISPMGEYSNNLLASIRPRANLAGNVVSLSKVLNIQLSTCSTRERVPTWLKNLDWDVNHHHKQTNKHPHLMLMLTLAAMDPVQPHTHTLYRFRLNNLEKRIIQKYREPTI